MSDGSSMGLDCLAKRHLLQEFRQKWIYLTYNGAGVTRGYRPIIGEVRGFSEGIPHHYEDNHWAFIQGPSRLRGIIPRGFNFRQLDVDIVAIKTYTAQDLLVALTRTEEA